MRRKGWLYEQTGHEFFLDKFGFLHYIPSQWFQYEDEDKRVKFCQTDGLLFNETDKSVLILEFKYKHTVEAYKQLEFKYVPVVKSFLPNWSIRTCEVVKWFDPSTPFPVPVTLKESVESTKPNEFGVFIFNPS